MSSLNLGESGASVEGARESCIASAQSHGFMGMAEIQNPVSLPQYYSVQELQCWKFSYQLSSFGTRIERATGNQTPAALIIEICISYSENFLSFLAHIDAVISNNIWVILFTEPAILDLAKTLS